MRAATAIAWEVALVGALFGAFVVLRDNLAMWQSLPDLDPIQAAARVFGGAMGGAVIGWLGGYAFGLWRNRRNA